MIDHHGDSEGENVEIETRQQSKQTYNSSHII